MIILFIVTVLFYLAIFIWMRLLDEDFEYQKSNFLILQIFNFNPKLQNCKTIIFISYLFVISIIIINFCHGCESLIVFELFRGYLILYSWYYYIHVDYLLIV